MKLLKNFFLFLHVSLLGASILACKEDTLDTESQVYENVEERKNKRNENKSKENLSFPFYTGKQNASSHENKKSAFHGKKESSDSASLNTHKDNLNTPLDKNVECLNSYKGDKSLILFFNLSDVLFLTDFKENRDINFENQVYDSDLSKCHKKDSRLDVSKELSVYNDLVALVKEKDDTESYEDSLSIARNHHYNASFKIKEVYDKSFYDGCVQKKTCHSKDSFDRPCKNRRLSFSKSHMEETEFKNTDFHILDSLYISSQMANSITLLSHEADFLGIFLGNFCSSFLSENLKDNFLGIKKESQDRTLSETVINAFIAAMTSVCKSYIEVKQDLHSISSDTLKKRIFKNMLNKALYELPGKSHLHYFAYGIEFLDTAFNIFFLDSSDFKKQFSSSIIITIFINNAFLEASYRQVWTTLSTLVFSIRSIMTLFLPMPRASFKFQDKSMRLKYWRYLDYISILSVMCVLIDVSMTHMHSLLSK